MAICLQASDPEPLGSAEGQTDPTTHALLGMRQDGMHLPFLEYAPGARGHAIEAALTLGDVDREQIHG